MLRNILSISIGVVISIVEILCSIKLVKKWFAKIQLIPLKKFKYLLTEAPTEFFIILIFFYASSALLGGIITAFFTKNAKKAYAILTGFILFIITIFHMFFYPFPLWFKIMILPIFSFFSYIGGNFIEFLQRKKWIN
ncbi:hypothetical protein [Blattabacterium sp. (Blaberus giganteus)]|uniref:hypothetical protein n=1 Tax=Blattabacterium sp. (Blaberus giganteus) TaxID=1186051 RepID=UPI00025F6F70|nr:hypothetical protein [Blattabacterium sp. (Blaberus giganteus)]AFJ90799.1 hypothetical protein BGIGA_361 [Blattabacterium sp. (Blaberus giganteus)]